jgi:DNA-binding NarL/FixJ family response regulator
MSAPPTTLVLADDQPIVLEGLQQLLASERDFAVLATCRAGDPALVAVRRHRPDVLVLGLPVSGTEGLAVLRALQAEPSPTRVVVLTASPGPDDLLDLVRLGAQGLVPRDTAPHLLVQCIRKVAAGGQWLEREMMTQTLTRLVSSEAEDGGSRLTAREREIVRLVADGRRNKEIARQLAITEGTVKIHLYNKKVGVDNRLGLMVYAQKKDLT